MNPIDILSPITSGNDLAYNWVRTLIPDGSSPFGDAFAVFTACLVFFGSLMLGWHILSGIVQSAYSGKVLGERWHQIWAPLRVVVGFGMLIPVAGGFSSVHFLLRDVVAVAAINMGNAPIETFIASVAGKGNTITPISGSGLHTVIEIAKKEVCVGVRNGYQPDETDFEGPPASGVLENVAWFGTTNQRSWKYGDCGNLYFAVPDEGEGEFETARRDAIATIVREVRPVAARFAGIWNASSETVTGADSLRPILANAGINATIDQWMAGLADRYNDAVSSAAARQVAQVNSASRDELVGYIHERGFMASGVYWRALSQMSARTAELNSQELVSTGRELDRNVALRVDNAHAALSQVARLDSASLSSEVLSEAGADESSVGYWMGQVLKPITNASKWLTDQWVRGPSADPVGDMINVGHWMLNLVSVAIVAMLVLFGGAGAADGNQVTKFLGAGAALPILQYLAGWLQYMLLIFLLVGLIQAYVLPMIPFIMVFMMGLGWLTIFLEATIAVTVWAFVFIRMDGTEFVDQHQKQGAALLFNLLLRPALSMLALVGGMHLLPLVLNTLATLWSLGFYGQQGNSFVGVFGLLASIIIYAYLQWQICLRIFGLIPTITDRISHWSGLGNSQGYGEERDIDAVQRGMVGLAVAGREAPIMPRRSSPPSPPQGDGGGSGNRGGDRGGNQGEGGGPSGGGGGGGNSSSSSHHTTSYGAGGGNQMGGAQSALKGEDGKGERGERGREGDRGQDGRSS